MRRREFLLGSAASAGLLLAGRSAYGRRWGEAPTESEGLILAPGVRAQRVLEIFLYGGISPWESFYTVPTYGTPNDPDHPNQQFHLFRNQHQAVFSEYCGLAESQWTQPFALDADGAQVHLGPLAMPLRNRPDLVARMRTIVLRHGLEPHEAAIPLALSGMRLGSPRLVGMGAHIQRHFMEFDPRPEPYSYVLQPENIIGTDNTRAADAIGLHPGAARPLALKINRSQSFLTQLDRANLGNRRAAWDALASHYAEASRDRYRATDTPLRSAGLDDHASAYASIQRSDAIRSVLGDDFMNPRSGESCGDSAELAFTTMGLDAAVRLLTHPTSPARYVNVVDSGLRLADGGGGYDTHSEHLYTQSRNTLFMLEDLVSRINAPGENDPSKIDLDDTLIVLTTEFGRTPFRQEGGQGTNHHPYGYVNVVLGGPIGPDQAGIVGAIGPDGTATDWVTPSELRAALLAAVGIYPFTHESFAVGDVRDVPTERDALALLQERVLGRPA
ncbi:MAG: DUF1501 domain-containing protein [Myxococcota bacterium]